MANKKNSLQNMKNLLYIPIRMTCNFIVYIHLHFFSNLICHYHQFVDDLPQLATSTHLLF